MGESQQSFHLTPGGALTGTLAVAGDKSISHRSIMLGALAEGTTTVEGFLPGEDTLATLAAFRQLGVTIEGPIDGRVVIHGVGLHGLKAADAPLYLGNSGTSMRLMCGLLAAQPFATVLTGDSSLSRRPMNRVAIPLRQMGAQIGTSAEGHPPVTIASTQRLHGIEYAMPVASAQVKSALLLAGLYAQGETAVIEPAPTRDHTERMLRSLGYRVESHPVAAGQRISLQGGGTLRAIDIQVPGDISSAAFFIVGATIAPGSNLLLRNVGINPTRTGVIDILRQMGADISLERQYSAGDEPVADLRIRHAPLRGIEIPEALVPLAIDEFPAILVAAAQATGETVLSGASELRVKESDRIQAMADGLKVLGVDSVVRPDGIVLRGGAFGGGRIDSHGDHRIAMAFAMAALRASAPLQITDCANVATSFPNFAASAQQAGLGIRVENADG